MNERPHYNIIFIYSDKKQYVENTKEGLQSTMDTLDIDHTLLNFHTNNIPFSDFERFCIGVYFGSNDASTSETCVELILTLLGNNILIIPVLSRTDRVEDTIPEVLRPIQAIKWIDSNSRFNLAHIILRELGLTEKERKVFLSYRRSDGQEMANQLFDALRRKRFEVFLDDFSIEIGEDFQAKLWNSLGDYAFLVLLESPEAEESEWIFEEINFALENEIGILILTWPDTSIRVSNTNGLNRINLTYNNIEVGSRGLKLKDAILPKILDEIETFHASSLLNRRISLITSLEEHLNSQYRIKKLTSWFLHVEPLFVGFNPAILGITPRKPNIKDYYAIDTLPYRNLEVDKDSRFLIHLDTALTPGDISFINWLDQISNIKTKLMINLIYGNGLQDE